MSRTKKHTASANLLLDGLQGKGAPVWHNVWSGYIATRLVDHAYRQIDFTMGVSRPALVDMDDPIKRSKLVEIDSVAINDCADRLMESTSELNAIFLEGGVTKRSRKELQTLLNEDGVVSVLMRTPGSNAMLMAMSPKAIWPALAHRIARELYKAELNGNGDPEWLLWNKLLLSRFFYTCQLDSAQQVAGQLRMLSRGLHGPRSCLLAITERVCENGVVDPLLPLPSGRGSARTGLKGSHLSDLLSAIQHESRQMVTGQGIVHKYADVNAPTLIPTRLRDRLTPKQLVIYRDYQYRQYEAAFLGYGALCAIEQLLRSLATNRGVPHLRGDGTPRPVGNWLARLDIDADLFRRLEELYSADGPNLRNRAMHAGLFETNSRGLEVIVAAGASAVGPTLPGIHPWPRISSRSFYGISTIWTRMLMPSI